MPAVDRSVLWRAALVQALAVAVLSIALALALPHSFFEDWGWLAGPGAWIVCALVTARVVRPADRRDARRRRARRAAEHRRRDPRRPLARRRAGDRRSSRCGARGWPATAAWRRGRLAPAPRSAGRPPSIPAMDLGLNGKVALVTGASKGIGRGIAAELVAEGARVAISSHSRERVEATAAEIGATAYVHDTSDLDHAAVARRRGRRRRSARSTSSCATPAGRPAAPTPSASRATSGRPPTRRSSSARWRSSRPSSPGMRERGFGRVLNVASHRRARADPEPDALQRPPDLDDQRLQDHRPPGRGRRRDPQHRPPRPHRHRPPGRAARQPRGRRGAAAEQEVPAGRLGTVEEFAAIAVLLCSARASYVTGETVAVDGGLLRSVF